MTEQAKVEDGYFFLHSKDQAERFERWVKSRQFNNIRTDLEDRKKQPMIGLSWRGSDGSVDKRGVIGCANYEIHDWAKGVISQVQQEVMA